MNRLARSKNCLRWHGPATNHPALHSKLQPTVSGCLIKPRPSLGAPACRQVWQSTSNLRKHRLAQCVAVYTALNRHAIRPACHGMNRPFQRNEKPDVSAGTCRPRRTRVEAILMTCSTAERTLHSPAKHGADCPHGGPSNCRVWVRCRATGHMPKAAPAQQICTRQCLVSA